jgi:hypothetical protein
MRAASLGLAVTGCVLLAAACAGPVPGYNAYRHAALNTATAMVSNLATAQLATETALRGGNLFAFTDNTVTDAENDADSVSSTFGSRQPPDARSGALGQQMSQALSQASSALTSLRIAIRWDNRAQILKALGAVRKSLQAFRHLQQELR